MKCPHCSKPVRDLFCTGWTPPAGLDADMVQLDCPRCRLTWYAIDHRLARKRDLTTKALERLFNG